MFRVNIPRKGATLLRTKVLCECIVMISAYYVYNSLVVVAWSLKLGQNSGRRKKIHHIQFKAWRVLWHLNIGFRLKRRKNNINLFSVIGIKIGNLLLLFTTNKHLYTKPNRKYSSTKKKEINNPIKPSNNNIYNTTKKEYLG